MKDNQNSSKLMKGLKKMIIIIFKIYYAHLKHSDTGCMILCERNY